MVSPNDPPKPPPYEEPPLPRPRNRRGGVSIAITVGLLILLALLLATAVFRLQSRGNLQAPEVEMSMQEKTVKVPQAEIRKPENSAAESARR